MGKEKKRHRLDRKDAYYVQDADSMHKFFPYVLPNRADNEAVMSETVDLTAIKAYLEKKNADSPEFKYTFFHVICAAIAKTMVLRPRLNRFYSGQRLYQRKDITLTFVAKKKFADNSDEALAIIKLDETSDVAAIEQIYGKIKKFVYSVRREGKTDGTTDAMDMLLKLGRPLVKLVVRLLNFLEYHGWYPESLRRDDPYYSSVFISNLGSIKMHASYHHLANWGTNSLFVVIDEKKPMPFYSPDGSFEIREGLKLGITVDERIADGVYFANSIKLLRKLLENPELLELPVLTEVEL